MDLHTLTPQLKQLRLSGILETLDVRHQQAITEKWSYVEFLERLLQDEVERHHHKQLTLRLRRAAFQPEKTLERYDFSFNPQLNRQQVMDLATCQFVARKEPVLICGPTGVGKSHLAQALGHAACRRGFDVVYVSAARMLQHLAGGHADGTYERRLAGYVRPDLLIIDDFGLKPLRPPAPEVFYDVVNERYERGATVVTSVVTSNRALDEWPQLFGDPLTGPRFRTGVASAGLDRLFHNAHALPITGPSFRAHTRRGEPGAAPPA